MCKLYQPQGLETIPKINKGRAFNKAIGPGKKSQIKSNQGLSLFRTIEQLEKWPSWPYFTTFSRRPVQKGPKLYIKVPNFML